MRRQIAYYTNKLNFRSDDSKQPIIEGLAVPYDTWSLPIYGMFKEKFKKGAFRSFLMGSPDVFALREHNPEHILGRTKSGTLSLKETDDGVYATVSVPNCSYANDLVESIRRQDIQGMSFYFDSVSEKDEWGKEDGIRTRVITEATMTEVTFTSCPFYEATTAKVRSMEAMTKEEMQEFLQSKEAKPVSVSDTYYRKLALMILGK